MRIIRGKYGSYIAYLTAVVAPPLLKWLLRSLQLACVPGLPLPNIDLSLAHPAAGRVGTWAPLVFRSLSLTVEERCNFQHLWAIFSFQGFLVLQQQGH